MLHFNKITIQNFGPYYGTQVVSLKKDDGVSFIWGLNGFGKTSFLNAIRFALWGSLANSKHASRPIVKFINRKAIANNEHMMVRLDCDYDNQKCVIIRSYRRNLLGDGTKNEDYDYSFTVTINASTLSQSEAQTFLTKTFPEDISRFYLFDAELLEQYESLVEENNNNTSLKLEIERILGLPILEKSLHCLSTGSYAIKNILEKDFEKKSKEGKQNQKKIKAFEAALDCRNQLTNEINSLKQNLSELYNNKENLEDTLTENQQFRNLVEKETILIHDIENQENIINSYKVVLSKALGSVWHIYLNNSIDSLINRNKQELKKLKEKAQENKEEHLISDFLHFIENRHESNCPICNGVLSPEVISNLKKRIEQSSFDNNISLEISDLSSEIAQLSELKNSQNKENLITAINEYLKSLDKLREYQLELSKINSQKNSYHTEITSSEIKKIAENYSNVSAEISEGEKGLKNLNVELDGIKDEIDRLRKEINKDADESLKCIEHKRKFIETLESIFNDAVDCFREDLKERVQNSASQIFNHISHNADYTGLKINDNYGLEIITNSGDVVPNRSAGYEQVVAISLIAALHKNAPIAGPIIMDSTFQRIDSIHKKATLQELPNLGQQILVLAYPDEVNKSEAKNLLASKYLQDFELRQIDSLETHILTSNNYE